MDNNIIFKSNSRDLLYTNKNVYDKEKLKTNTINFFANYSILETKKQRKNIYNK